MKINAWDLGSETEDKPRIPVFAKSKYMVTGINPPKGKTIREGLVVSAALISYTNNNGEEIKVTEVFTGPSGFEVAFPLGKFLVRATKYRGPKSWYNFVHPTTGKWTRIPQEKFTVEFAKSLLSAKVSGWDLLSEVDKDDLIDSYFEDMYNFGLACDFNFDTAEKDFIIPKVGMLVEFYRRYTPPVGDEKYGNTIITKWPNKKDTTENTYDALDGSFEQKDVAIAEAIIAALSTSEKPKEFDPTSDDEDDVPF